MAPPAKRQKRNVVTSSDSSEEDQKPQPNKRTKTRLISLVSSPPVSAAKPTALMPPDDSEEPLRNRKQPRPKTANHPHNAAPIYLPQHNRGRTSSKSASNSPEKSRQKAKVEEKVKSGNLLTFFTKQVQRQQAEGSRSMLTAKPRTRLANGKGTKIEDHDVISDDNVDESGAQATSLVGLAEKKRGTGINALTDHAESYSSSQRFVKKPKPPPLITRNEDDMRPWADRFGPVNLEELAVHKRKVGDVRAWLENVMAGRMRQRLLLLKGAAGTGKTTTVQLLARDMDCGVLEWRNPVGSVAGSDGFQSIAAQFEEFMGRGGRFGQLSLLSTEGKPGTDIEAKPLDRRKQIILVEDFPNTFTRSSTALQSFRSSIINYLASNTPPLTMFNDNKAAQEPVTPVVMIISETLLSTASASADSFTAHRLLGAEVLQHPGVGIIEFNAMAPTLLAKALELIVQKESRKSGRKSTPGPLVLKKLGEIGDVRSAIGSLEFLCLRGDVDGNWGSKVAFVKTKKSKEAVPLTKMEEQSLELVTRREASLGIFHAVGRVVYNKRDDPAESSLQHQAVERLPGFLSQHSRPMKSQVPVDELIDEMGTDTQTFIAALHENYILSCEAPPSAIDISTIDHINSCLDFLSDSDLLSPSWEKSFGSSLNGTAGDILRQDEVSFQVAVRGLLFSLPHPVKRRAPPGSSSRPGKGGDPYKMFYPTSLKLWRAKEEMESTLSLWVTKLTNGEGHNMQSVTAEAAVFARAKPGSIESWKNASGPPPASSKPVQGKESEPDNASPLLSIAFSARKEMLIERLPYMTLLARSRRHTGSAFSIRELEKITSFHGIDGPSEDVPEEADNGAIDGEENWATDKPIEGSSPRKKGLVVREKGDVSGLPIAQPQQKLVLSDDDIED